MDFYWQHIHHSKISCPNVSEEVPSKKLHNFAFNSLILYDSKIHKPACFGSQINSSCESVMYLVYQYLQNCMQYIYIYIYIYICMQIYQWKEILYVYRDDKQPLVMIGYLLFFIVYTVIILGYLGSFFLYYFPVSGLTSINQPPSKKRQHTKKVFTLSCVIPVL